MDNCILNITSLNLSLNLNQEVYLSTFVLAKHSQLEEWKLNSNPKIMVTWKFRMLSMDWDAFDGIRTKKSAPPGPDAGKTA